MLKAVLKWIKEVKLKLVWEGKRIVLQMTSMICQHINKAKLQLSQT